MPQGTITRHGELLRVVRIRALLVTRIATDVRNGVGLANVIGVVGLEAGIRLNVDKHTGGP